MQVTTRNVLLAQVRCADQRPYTTSCTAHEQLQSNACIHHVGVADRQNWICH